VVLLVAGLLSGICSAGLSGDHQHRRRITTGGLPRALALMFAALACAKIVTLRLVAAVPGLTFRKTSFFSSA
jgi:hypothetical protein